MFLQNKDANKDRNTDGSSSDRATEKESESQSVISGWKLYTNAEAKFSISCPEDWTFKEDKDEYGNITVSFISPEAAEAVRKETEDMGGNYGASGIDFSIDYASSLAEDSSNKSNEWNAKTLEELIEKDSTVKKIGEIGLNGVRATEVGISGEAQYYGLYIEKDGRFYKIVFQRWDKENLTEADKKILSTFKIN